VPLLLTIRARVNSFSRSAYSRSCSIESMQRTEGVVLRFCASGSCSIGDAGREDLEAPFAV
jgi:hypothetical protein